MASVLQDQLQGLLQQQSDLKTMIDTMGEAGDSLLPLLGDLDAMIVTLEAELLKVRSQDQVAAESNRKEEDRLAVGMQVIVRRYNGQLADAYIEDLNPQEGEDDGDTCLISWAHPRSRSEIVCRFWKKGACRRERGSCKFSHGVLWKKDELRPVGDAATKDDEGVRREQTPYGDRRCPLIGERVLALYFNDGVWYEGVIDEIINHEDGSRPTCMVRMSRGEGGGGSRGVGELTEVEAHESCLIPLSFFEAAGSSLVASTTSNTRPNQRKRDRTTDDDEEEEEEDEEGEERWSSNGPRALGALAAELGQWERYSKGVGFSLLKRMGYRAGEGLGKEKQGVTEPIEIRIFEPRVGLDFVGEGKAAEWRDPEAEMKEKEVSNKPKKDPMSVFSFINNLRVDGEGEEEDGATAAAEVVEKNKASYAKHKEMVARDEAELRAEIVGSMGKKQELDDRLVKLKESLGRHEKTNPAMASSIRSKMAELEERKARLEGEGQKIKAVLSKKKEERKKGKHLF